jgi:hypothetical protein
MGLAEVAPRDEDVVAVAGKQEWRGAGLSGYAPVVVNSMVGARRGPRVV